MFHIVSIPSGENIEACAKFLIGEYEVSVTSHPHTGLCVFKGDANITEELFGEKEVAYPSAEQVAKALQWCAEKVEQAKRDRAQKLSLFSDYHKDFCGWRPDTSRMTEDEILDAWDNIDKEFAALKATKEGREKLRVRGWSVLPELGDVLKLEHMYGYASELDAAAGRIRLVPRPDSDQPESAQMTVAEFVNGFDSIQHAQKMWARWEPVAGADAAPVS